MSELGKFIGLATAGALALTACAPDASAPVLQAALAAQRPTATWTPKGDPLRTPIPTWTLPFEHLDEFGPEIPPPPDIVNGTVLVRSFNSDHPEQQPNQLSQILASIMAANGRYETPFEYCQSISSEPSPTPYPTAEPSVDSTITGTDNASSELKKILTPEMIIDADYDPTHKKVLVIMNGFPGREEADYYLQTLRKAYAFAPHISFSAIVLPQQAWLAVKQYNQNGGTYTWMKYSTDTRKMFQVIRDVYDYNTSLIVNNLPYRSGGSYFDPNKPEEEAYSKVDFGAAEEGVRVGVGAAIHELAHQLSNRYDLYPVWPNKLDPKRLHGTGVLFTDWNLLVQYNRSAAVTIRDQNVPIYKTIHTCEGKPVYVAGDFSIMGMLPTRLTDQQIQMFLSAGIPMFTPMEEDKIFNDTLIYANE